MKTRGLFDDIRDALTKTKADFYEITDKLPDDAFMGEYAQQSFDSACNQFPRCITDALEHLKTMSQYEYTLKREMRK